MYTEKQNIETNQRSGLSSSSKQPQPLKSYPTASFKMPVDCRPEMEEQRKLISLINNDSLLTCEIETTPENNHKTIQRVSTQISIGPDNIIQKVIIRGRPKNSYSASMGDHTTAYSVHTESINIALVGHPLGDAIVYLKYLTEKITNLPGFSFLHLDVGTGTSNTEVGATILENYYLLNLLLDRAEQELNLSRIDFAVNYIQQATTTYLSLRELIPFSTINVKESGLSFGKGHGESSPLTILSVFERTGTLPPETTNASEMLDIAVTKLFDFQSAGVLAYAANIHEANILTNDIFTEEFNRGDTLMLLIWQQHLMTIEVAFPKVFAVIHDRLLNPPESILKIMIDNKINGLFNNIIKLCNRIKHICINMPWETTSQDTKDRIERFIEIRSTEVEISELLAEVHSLNKPFTELYEMKAQTIRQWLSSFEIDEMQRFNLFQEHDKIFVQQLLGKSISQLINGHGSSNFALINNFLESLEPSIQIIPVDKKQEQLPEAQDCEPFMSAKTSIKNASTLISLTSPLSIQLILRGAEDHENQDFLYIKNMISTGRPRSPFKTGMGAHTTAWIVHLDRIRKEIINYPLPVAYNNILILAESFIEIANTLGASPIFFNDYNQMLEQFKSYPPSLNNLQNLINEILTFYNFIPYVTIDKANTSGHGEGYYRNILIRFEQEHQPADAELIKTAIFKLFDGTKASPIFILHMQIIQNVYPDCYRFAIENKSDVLSKAPNTQLTEDMADQEDETSLEENETPASKREEIPDNLTDQELKQQLGSGNIDPVIQEIALKNNCLIRAIAEFAGINITDQELINYRLTLRVFYNIPLGRMLAADQNLLDILGNMLGVQDRGIIVFYDQSPYTDNTSTMGARPILIHFKNNHFMPYNDIYATFAEA